MIKYAIKVLSILVIILNISSSYAEEGVITMAVSQSIYHSSILSYFVPLFEKKMPYRLKTISASNEEAIEMARRGEVDILFINRTSFTDKFLADRSGINSQNVMHNFSVIIGPKDDPARIRGRDPVGAFKKIAKGDTPFIHALNAQMLIRWKKGFGKRQDWHLERVGI